MNFIKYIRLSICGAIAVSLLASCDEVSSGDRFIGLPPVEMQRVVLLEEFTGQFCVNCPNAHATIAALLQQYPDNLISVSIHAGGDAFSMGEEESDPTIPGLIGLRIPEGEAYAASHGVSAFPSGVINRTSGVQTSDLWAATIRTEVEKPSDLSIDLHARLSDDASSIEITTGLTAYENLSGFLQLWVVESGIEAMQIQPDGNIVWDYIHNHVFRATVNGQNGDAVTLLPREPEQMTHSIALKPIWNPEALSIVAFVYNNKGVIQAAEAHVGQAHLPEGE